MTGTGIGNHDCLQPLDALLRVQDLRISFQQRSRTVTPVDGVDFSVGRGERVALVGESGSGKSLTALAIMRLVGRQGGRMAPEARIEFDGRELTALDEGAMRAVRGGEIAMIFQDPQTSMNPVYSVGHQVVESVLLHGRAATRREARELALQVFADVWLPHPERILKSYPHELSGGMRQRAMIAMALAGDPKLLIADEPTTALDVPVQAEILDLLLELGERRGMAVLLITHDLGVVTGFTRRTVVMYSGRVVEEGATESVLTLPQHPYTRALLHSVPPLTHRVARLPSISGVPPEPAQRPAGCAFHPRCEFVDPVMCAAEVPLLRDVAGPAGARSACLLHDRIDLALPARAEAVMSDASKPPASAQDDVLVAVERLRKVFPVRGGRGTGSREHVAVDDVSFDVLRGESLGLVGQSGSGKTTVARMMMGFIKPTAGRVLFDSHDLQALPSKRLRALRAQFQMVFQDPGSSLNARMRVRDVLAEPLRIHKTWGTDGSDEEWLRELLDLVRLPADSLDRYPHQFSGGQRQRIAIARALALRPSLLVCDEAVSALDVSVRASILNLLADLQDRLSLAMVFIAHDMSLVRYLCSRVAVMYGGRLVELSDTATLFSDPQHWHTRDLLAAQPVVDLEVAQRQREERARRRAARPSGEEPVMTAGAPR